jgi:acetyl coenzyme A synthetase (ADP forming)-like protein
MSSNDSDSSCPPDDSSCPPEARASLLPFFRPSAVAVIGASRDPARIGARLLDAVLKGGFRGRVYPVNPRASAVAGLRSYSSVRELPEAVDLALIAVPRDAVLAVVDDCAAHGVHALVIITAGFAEACGEGRELQQLLAERVRRHGMRLVGPNCLGLLTTDPAVRLDATFIPVALVPGRVAMSSDSGALGLALLATAGRLGLGISSFVSVGNRADVSSNDLLEYWEQDDLTGVVLLYLESFGNPRRFARIARRAGRCKPIVAVKAGRTSAGRRAAGSHTAALAASDVAIDALFRQTGVIRAETLEEMIDLALALGSQPLPRGRRVAVVTNAGGPAILCADACEAGGLRLPELSATTRGRLASFLPASASITNPIDMIASATPEQYGRAVEILLSSGEADALVVIYVAAGVCDGDCVARVVGEGAAAARKATGLEYPVLACWMPEPGPRSLPLGGGQVVPCYPFPETAGKVLSKVVAYAEWRSRPLGTVPSFPDIDTSAVRDLCRTALAQRGAGWLTTEETRAVLSAMGLPLAPGGVARSADEAAALARGLGFPVAVKLASHEIVHKTEIGGVRLHLDGESAVRRAFEEIRGRLESEGRLAAMEGVLVQPMVSGGTEVMVGVAQDPLFGPLIAIGLGGMHVEVLGDVCFRVTPLTDSDAAEMVRSIRGYRLFQGYRGHAPADVAAIENVLLRVSLLVEEVPEVRELDLNPVFALPPGKGCRIVDARVRVEPTSVTPGLPFTPAPGPTASSCPPGGNT